MIKRIVAVIALLATATAEVEARELTEKQQERAEEIADICVEEWGTYGVLPSTCIGQALVESTLGEHCSGNNLWGIKSGAEDYSSIAEGTYRYLGIINNGCYEGAPFQTNPSKQISAILAGGYCEPVGEYYENFMWLVDEYELKSYDEPIFVYLKREKQSKTFICKYDANLSQEKVRVSNEIAEQGCIGIYRKKVLQGLYDVVPDEEMPLEYIYTGKRELDNVKVKIEVTENAKG